MGLGDQIVGRTAFCIHPKDRIKQVPSIGGTKQVNMDKVTALGATHLIVNIDENPKELVEELSKFIPNVIVTHPNTPTDNVELFQLIGNVFNKKGEAARLISEFHAALTHAQMSALELNEKKVLYFIWKDPWMTIGTETYIAQSLKVFNCTTVPQETERRYPEIEVGNMSLDQVDAILFSTEPFLFKPPHLDEFAETFKVPREKLHIIDGEMTSWYGSRVISGLRYLTEFVKEL